MKLHDDWWWIIRKAWSVRLIVLAALLSGIEIILPYCETFIPRGIFAALSFVVTVSAFIARIVVQPKGE